ncbi:MAG: coenzyme F420-0:L-glutamate ligase [Candidatus Wildermuthbacteria bacterium]|nr:coenzyme F420-0:L-glutamate ligase [Candidatus Wildermuthbacteria bacterium]
MNVTAHKTRKIIPGKESNIFDVLDEYLQKPREGSVVAVTSKIVAICEGSIVRIGAEDKDVLIQKECELYLPRSESKYGVCLTMKNSLLVPTAGIDESNGNGYYILLPKDPQASANAIRSHLVKRFRLRTLGVIVTDSKTTPLRRGVTGVCVAHSGFRALNDFRKKPDIFGHMLKVTQVNVVDALATAAVLCMGESKEQTPLAVLEDLPFVHFQRRNPTKQEVEFLKIPIEHDLYEPILRSVQWKQGGRKYEKA